MKAADLEITPAECANDDERTDKTPAEAVREAVEQHRRAGNPVAAWREGCVCWGKVRDIPEALAVEQPQD